jgi:hypothetical protein
MPGRFHGSFSYFVYAKLVLRTGGGDRMVLMERPAISSLELFRPMIESDRSPLSEELIWWRRK